MEETACTTAFLLYHHITSHNHPPELLMATTVCIFGLNSLTQKNDLSVLLEGNPVTFRGSVWYSLCKHPN